MTFTEIILTICIAVFLVFAATILTMLTHYLMKIGDKDEPNKNEPNKNEPNKDEPNKDDKLLKLKSDILSECDLKIQRNLLGMTRGICEMGERLETDISNLQKQLDDLNKSDEVDE